MATNDISFDHLEQKVDDLLQHFAKLEEQNQVLQESEIEWQSERNQLVRKIELARTKIESIISRLKVLEQDG